MRQRSRASAARSVSTLEELRDDVGRAPSRPDVEHGDDVGVIQGGGRPGFLLEPLQAVDVAGHVGAQHLDGDVALQACVVRAIDLAHAAGAHRSENLVRPETGASVEGQASRDYSVRAAASHGAAGAGADQVYRGHSNLPITWTTSHGAMGRGSHHRRRMTAPGGVRAAGPGITGAAGASRGRPCAAREGIRGRGRDDRPCREW